VFSPTDLALEIANILCSQHWQQYVQCGWWLSVFLSHQTILVREFLPWQLNFLCIFSFVTGSAGISCCSSLLVHRPNDCTCTTSFSEITWHHLIHCRWTSQELRLQNHIYRLRFPAWESHWRMRGFQLHFLASPRVLCVELNLLYPTTYFMYHQL